MFGYVTPFKPELRIREYEIFKSYYCGLCREIGNKSFIARFTITYDMTFLGLLLSSLYTNSQEKFEKILCVCKFKKMSAAASNQFLKYAADMNIVLSSRKFFDNYIDTKNPVYYFLSRIIQADNFSDMVKDKINKIDYSLNKLRILEKLRCNNIDEVGECFGEITSEIFAINDDKSSKILRHLGYNLGKWIYTADAYDDLEKDIKYNNYNPCIYMFGYKGRNPKEFKTSIKDNIEFTLYKCLNEISNAFQLLEFKKNADLIENIIYFGLKHRTMSVIEGGCRCEKPI